MNGLLRGEVIKKFRSLLLINQLSNIIKKIHFYIVYESGIINGIHKSLDSYHFFCCIYEFIYVKIDKKKKKKDEKILFFWVSMRNDLFTRVSINDKASDKDFNGLFIKLWFTIFSTFFYCMYEFVCLYTKIDKELLDLFFRNCLQIHI